MQYGDLVYVNLAGETNLAGILIDVRFRVEGRRNYFAYEVLLSNGTVKTYSFSQLLTVEEVEKYGITA